MELTTIPIPMAGKNYAQLFPDIPSAVRHLSDHVFVHPEAQAWAVILPDWHDILCDANRRHNERSRFLQTQGSLHNELYQSFACVIEREIQDAHTLRWYVHEKGVYVILGTRAILSIVEHKGNRWIIRTVFIPGLGAPDKTKEAITERRPRSDSFRRTSPMARRQRNPNLLHPKENLQRMEREQQWSEIEWYYKRVFSNAIRFLRREYLTHRLPCGRIDTNGGYRDYRLLYPQLPETMKRPTFETWIQFRKEIGYSENQI